MKLVDYRNISDSEILLTWENNERGIVTVYDLRLFCPCAGCRDEWTGKRILTPEKVPLNITAPKSEPVGQYGIRFQFSDGHTTGIYSFAYLREICENAKEKK